MNSNICRATSSNSEGSIAPPKAIMVQRDDTFIRLQDTIINLRDVHSINLKEEYISPSGVYRWVITIEYIDRDPMWFSYKKQEYAQHNMNRIAKALGARED